MKLLQELLELRESSEATKFDVTKFDIDDIILAIKNGGFHNISKSDFDFAKNEDAFKYLGYVSKYKNHIFSIAFEDEEKEDEDKRFYVSHVVLWLGSSGKIEADFTDMPVEDDLTEEEAIAYVKADKLTGK